PEATLSDLVRDACGTEALDQVELAPSRLSLLGRNDDNAVRASRAVDGAGRGSLEHLNALDVVGVDVGGTVDALVLARGEVSARRLGDRVEAVGDRRVVDDDAIDHVKREEARVDRGNSTKLNLNTSARRAGILR